MRFTLTETGNMEMDLIRGGLGNDLLGRLAHSDKLSNGEVNFRMNKVQKEVILK